MPIRSMTGFGQAEKTTPIGSYRVEVRGVNNRFLELQLRIPRSFSSLEQKIKKTVSGKLSRGYITILVSGNHDNEKEKLTWDKDSVESYLNIFGEIKKNYKLEGNIALRDLLQFSDFIKSETGQFDEESVWKHFEPVLLAALRSFQKARESEAVHIVRDLQKRINEIGKILGQVKKRAPLRIKRYTKELQCRVEQLLDSPPDPQRLAMEIAVMADRLDISEECTRLSAHVEQFNKTFKSNEPVGKRMNFLLQEMNREANTIGAKANDTPISHFSIKLKENIEKIREQVQNIE